VEVGPTALFEVDRAESALFGEAGSFCHPLGGRILVIDLQLHARFGQADGDKSKSCR
jgi:hypothetical protein